MQQAGNTTLAALLASGQERNFSVVLKFDWARNGLFNDPNSDLSALFQSAVIDRQLSGDFPEQIDITEGYVAAEMQVVLEGYLPADGVTPVWKAFSPYSGYYEGTAGAINTPVTLDCVVLSALVPGGYPVRQFTGYVSDGLPSAANGNVTVTCYDKSSQMTEGITLPTWAADWYTRVKLANSYADVHDSGSTLLTWVMETVLRRSGIYQGPPWHPNATCAWTLNGSGLPDLGTIGIEDPYVTEPGTVGFQDGNWSYGYGPYNMPQSTPAGPPSGIWGAGQFGNCCFVGSVALPPYSGGRNITYVSGNAHNTVAFYPSGSYGSNNSNIVGMGLWVKVGGGLSGTAQMTHYLEEAQFNYGSTGGGGRYPAYALFTVNHSTGAVTLTVKNNGWGTTWSWTASPNLSTGWHYVYVNIQFTSTAVNANIYDTGTLIGSGNGGTASALGAPGYSFATTNTNLSQVQISGPAQYAQVWMMFDTPLASVPVPQWTQPNVGCVLDQSLTRLTWMPDVNGTQAWELLKTMAAGELGAIFIDEQGIVRFNNRSTIKAAKLPANSVRTLSRDDFYELQPESTLSSVINQIPWSVDTKLAQSYSSVYKSPNSTTYAVPPNPTLPMYVTVTLANAVSIRLGPVSWHPQAQGYSNPVNPGEYGGAGPSGTFTWQDWMNIYGPDFWYDGFTAYAAGTTSPGNQPPAQINLNCYPLIGTVAGLQDTRQMTLELINSNSSGGALEFAVDDSTPFLHVGGTAMIDMGNTIGTASDPASVTTYGPRQQALPGSDWLQDTVAAPQLAASLLADVKQPMPYFQTIDIIGDPRMQLQDVLTLVDPLGMGASMPVSVVGINRKIDNSNGVRDTLTLRSM